MYTYGSGIFALLYHFFFQFWFLKSEQGAKLLLLADSCMSLHARGDSCDHRHTQWRAASSPQDTPWSPVFTVTIPVSYWHVPPCPGHSGSAFPESNIDEFLSETGVFPTAQCSGEVYKWYVDPSSLIS